MATIHLPAPLRPYADKQKSVAVSGATVGEALQALTKAHPAIRQHLFSDDGALRSFVNLYVDDRDVRGLKGLDTPLDANGQLTIVPAIAGGAPWAS